MGDTNRGPKIIERVNSNERLAVGRAMRKTKRGSEITERVNWYQALAVGRAKRKYELRPQANREMEVESSTGSGQGKEERGTEAPR